MADLKRLCRHAAEMLEQCQEVTIASVDESGFPRICVVSPIRREGYGVVYFATSVNSQKVRQFRCNKKAGLCYYHNNNSQTLTGTVDILEDVATKKALWQNWMLRHFPLGPEDPDYCVVKFTGKTATLWYEGEFETFEVE